jgi:hypothetical protein
MKKTILLCILFFMLSISVTIGAQQLERKHIVKKGDTLWDISGWYYDDPFLWPVIYRANQDSIADPHWIYPGEVFVIPGIPTEEVTTLPPAEKEIVIKQDTVSIEYLEKPYEEESGKPMQVKAGDILEEYTASSQVKLFSVVRAKDYVFTQKAAFLAGFITDEKDIDVGKVVETHSSLGEENISVLLGENVDIDKGTADGVFVGHKYTIFEWGKNVRGYGRIVIIKGILQIIKAGTDISTAKLLETYESVEKGDYIMDYIPPMPLEGEVHPTMLEIEGEIIAFKEKQDIIKPYSVVFITPGEGEVRPGDVFLIYELRKGSTEEKAPIVPLGKIQIVYVKEKSASGYITSIMGNMNIRVGDEIRLVGRVGS